jgi:hypothetical protein
MGKTIDEVIKEYKRVANTKREIYNNSSLKEKNKHLLRIAGEQEQLAEWLEELKQLRIEKEKKCDECTYYITVQEAFVRGYKDSIDDFVNACEQDIMCQRFGMRILDIKRVAERLKEQLGK